MLKHLFAVAVLAALTTCAAAQTPPPPGWLPTEGYRREELPAKFFGTWCKVSEKRGRRGVSTTSSRRAL